MDVRRRDHAGALFNDELARRKVEALYLQAPIANATIFVISSLFFFLLQGFVDSTMLGLWVLAMWATAAYRLLLWALHRRRGSRRPSRHWLRQYTIGCLLVGSAWGLIYLFLHDLSSIVVVVALFMLFFGVLSSTVAILSAHLPAFFAYALPQFTALAAVLLVQGDPKLNLLVVAFAAYMGMLSLFARNAYRQFEAVVRLNSANLDLVEQLNVENSQREQIILERTADLEHEVSERQSAEHKARVQFAQLRSVLDATPDLIFFKNYRDADGVYIGCNAAFCAFVGRTMDEIVGATDFDLFDDDVATFFRTKDRDMLDADETRLNEERVSYPDGRHVLLSTLKTPFRDADGQIVGVLGVSRDVTEQKRVEQALRNRERSLRHMAHYDALTDLPNRTLLTQRLSECLNRARRGDEALAVLFVDLDNFKRINDSLGHSVGDELLAAVSRRLLGSVRENDMVARLGGDEFVVLTEQVHGAESAAKMAEKILAAFAEPFELSEVSLPISASLGVSLYPEDGQDSEELLRNADAAMYRAKDDGRNTFRFYARTMTEQARTRVAIEGALRDALREGRFLLHYQPQIDIRSGDVVAVEALLRWQDPVRGLILPDAFIGIAEESGLIKQIGLWVLNQAARQGALWRKAGLLDVRIAINLSGREIYDNPLLAHVDDALARHGCPADALELEITESFLVQQPQQAKHLLESLRDRGLHIAVDDFGTGYSSLSYLKEFPISKLKIDQSFVRDLWFDSDDQAIVRAIIGLGESLELRVVAEGVETGAQARFLRQENCHFAQGFLFAQPMPADEVIGLIGEGTGAEVSGSEQVG